MINVNSLSPYAPNIQFYNVGAHGSVTCVLMKHAKGLYGRYNGMSDWYMMNRQNAIGIDYPHPHDQSSLWSFARGNGWGGNDSNDPNGTKPFLPWDIRFFVGDGTNPFAFEFHIKNFIVENGPSGFDFKGNRYAPTDPGNLYGPQALGVYKCNPWLRVLDADTDNSDCPCTTPTTEAGNTKESYDNPCVGLEGTYFDCDDNTYQGQNTLGAACTQNGFHCDVADNPDNNTVVSPLGCGLNWKRCTPGPEQSCCNSDYECQSMNDYIDRCGKNPYSTETYKPPPPPPPPPRCSWILILIIILAVLVLVLGFAIIYKRTS
jgi:hypothetical protein